MWISLASAEALDVERVGAKAAGVARLWQAGLPVPEGWCLPVEAERAGRQSYGLDSRGAGELRLDASQDAWRRPLALLRAQLASLPPSAELQASVARLCETEAGPLAVRSSAVGEDASFSGLLSSFLGVRGPEALLSAIQACWLSRWSDTVVRYALARGPDLRQLRMGVLVQRMVLARAAGGARSQAGQVTIEGTWGLGRGLAEGEVVPDAWRVQEGVVRVVRSGDKRLRVDLDAEGGETWRRVSDHDATRLCLDEVTVLELARLVQTAERTLGDPIAVEWAVDDQSQLWLLQATRPTGTRSQTADGWLDGLPASPGQAVGRARVIASDAELGGLGPGDVLVAERLPPGALAGAPLLAGLVLEAGGTTSHAATLARERGIPAVFGVRGATRVIEDGARLRIDGDIGQVLVVAWKYASPTKNTPR